MPIGIIARTFSIKYNIYNKYKIHIYIIYFVTTVSFPVRLLLYRNNIIILKYCTSYSRAHDSELVCVLSMYTCHEDEKLDFKI